MDTPLYPGTRVSGRRSHGKRIGTVTNINPATDDEAHVRWDSSTSTWTPLDVLEPVDA